MVLLLALYGAYQMLVAGPLEKALDERYARTDGAFEQAKQDIAAADARSQQYEQGLREARATIFKALENRRQQAIQARNAAAAEARKAAAARVQQEKAQIEQQMAAARAGLAQESERLATEIIQAVLTQGGSTRPAAGGPR